MATKIQENRVLLVEDENDLATLIATVLEEEGYQVLVQPTGDCFSAIEIFEPDLIMCDYMLPIYDGHQILHRLRTEIGSVVPFILMSAVPRAHGKWHAWGANEFLLKPFDLDQLLQTVKQAAMVDRPRSAKSWPERDGEHWSYGAAE